MPTSKGQKIRAAIAATFMASLCWPLLSQELRPADRMSYWAVQRRGANYGPARLRPGDLQAAADYGIEFLRLRVQSLRPAQRDFLLGNADDYRGINEADLRQLRAILDEAHKHGLKIVLVMFSLPGARAKNDVSDPIDGRIWRDERFQEQAFAFWRDLARELKNHPAIVAYNPLNEPHPEREFGLFSDDARFRKWLAAVRGTTADVDRFNRRMVAAIREVDRDVPIVLDGWFYADPAGFAHNLPVEDSRVLYALHNLGPWAFTTFRINKSRFAYPDRMPGPDDTTGPWTVENLRAIVKPVEAFAERHRIPAHRIIASEFLCDRRVAGAARYLADEISIYNERGWHWAFYSFRSEGAWTGLDFEIPPNAKVAHLWAAQARGEDLEPLKPRRGSPLWTVIERALKRR